VVKYLSPLTPFIPLVPDEPLVPLVPLVPDVVPTATPICFATTITEGAAGEA